MSDMTLQQAAVTLGISEKTVRRRVANGSLLGRQVATPSGYRWMVTLDDPIEPETPSEQPSQSPTADSDIIIGFLQGQVTDLRQQIAVKDEQIGHLHILLGQRQLDSAPKVGKWWQPWRR